MSGLSIAVWSFVAMLALIAVRMPVGLAMLASGSAGYLATAGWPAFLNYMKSTPYFLFSNYTLSVIPLFILMGAFAERSGLSQDLFRAASAIVGHRRGGMAMGVIGACTAFGAICGSSVATTATFGRAALPELERYRYAPSLSTGTIAVGGTLGILIPPSVILVVYAAFAAFIAWRLAIGAFEALTSRTTSMVLGLPIHYAISACAAMAAFLALIAVLTAIRRTRISS